MSTVPMRLAILLFEKEFGGGCGMMVKVGSVGCKVATGMLLAFAVSSRLYLKNNSNLCVEKWFCTFCDLRSGPSGLGF
eukprot:scaffold15086_cov84-Amphora_coffeaeformis.AAC.1